MVKGPKEKKERSLGVRLQIKGERCQSPKCAMVRKPYRPGVQGKSRRIKQLSDFGRQLKEKQKAKVSYGINERTLRQVFGKAFKKSGSTAANMTAILELRLDNVVYRMGFAPSRSAARQSIVQGHILVNKKRVWSPGFELKEGNTVAIRPESASKGAFKNLKESLAKYEAPSWLALDLEKLEGKVISLPQGTDLPFEVNSLVESFSK